MCLCQKDSVEMTRGGGKHANVDQKLYNTFKLLYKSQYILGGVSWFEFDTLKICESWESTAKQKLNNYWNVLCSLPSTNSNSNFVYTKNNGVKVRDTVFLVELIVIQNNIHVLCMTIISKKCGWFRYIFKGTFFGQNPQSLFSQCYKVKGEKVVLSCVAVGCVLRRTYWMDVRHSVNPSTLYSSVIVIIQMV